MKVPLRYQNTEYDCGTTSFVNALAYLYDREDIPVELLKQIYRLTLDIKGPEGVSGEGGTSRKHAELLADYFVEYANKNNNFDIKCKILRGENVNIKNMRESLEKQGVVIASCWQESEHYVLITKIDDYFAYIFDPYYLDKDYYVNDEDVTIVTHEDFTHNRLVKIERLFDKSRKDFSLLEGPNRSVILLSR
ncbi:C39 family peptidase [Candidatus Saccharibacteria bacterium]|nr:C39 family peptidase [Candidatus Saccharibacteria bacterium]